MDEDGRFIGVDLSRTTDITKRFYIVPGCYRYAYPILLERDDIIFQDDMLEIKNPDIAK